MDSMKFNNIFIKMTYQCYISMNTMTYMMIVMFNQYFHPHNKIPLVLLLYYFILNFVLYKKNQKDNNKSGEQVYYGKLNLEELV